MKNKLFSKLIVLALAVTALLSFSCKQSLDYTKVAGADAGNGSKVKVMFALSFGRTALPEIDSRLDDFKFVLKGALTGETQSTRSPEGGWSGKTAAEAATFELEEGHYDFTLTAEYNGLAYIGELTDVSVSGAEQTLAFVLDILDPTGDSTGSFSVNLAYPSAEASKVGKITASLYKLTVEDDDDVETLVENCENMALTPADGTDALENFKVAPLTKADLGCGHYVLKYSLFADAAGSVKLNRTPIEEDIILGGGINSSSLVKLSALPDVYTITYDLGSDVTEGSWAAEYSAPAVYTRITKPAIPEDENLEKPVNYHFAGWYENADFSGSAVTSLDSLYKNITLHAHWMPNSTRSTVAVTVQSNPDIKVESRVQGVGIVTFTAEDGYSNYKWYVNNGVSGVQGTGRVFVLDTTELINDYYTVTVRAEKNGIVWSTSSYIELDKEAPGRVSSSSLKISSIDAEHNKVTLQWTNPSDDDFAKVKIYWTDNGEQSKEVSGTKGAAGSTEITVSDATASYEFRVTSIDDKGNESASRNITSYPVIKISSGESYTVTESSRWAARVDGFDYKTVGNRISLKFKFTNFTNCPVNQAYVRTDKDKFLYFGAQTDTDTELRPLTGDWDGWYEVTGTVKTAGATKFWFLFQKPSSSTVTAPFTNNDCLYIADIKVSTDGGDFVSIDNSVISVSKDESITPFKGYADRSAAN